MPNAPSTAFASGRVYLRPGSQDRWYAHIRLPTGRQQRRKVGPAWRGRGRPPAGQYTRRTAEAWLEQYLRDLHAGRLPGLKATGVTVGEAADEWLVYIEQQRRLAPSTVIGYRSIVEHHVRPAIGDLLIEEVVPRTLARFAEDLGRRDGCAGQLAPNTRNRILVALNGIFKRATKLHELPLNPAAGLEKYSERQSGSIDVYEPAEIHRLAEAAQDPQDRVFFLTAAFTGLRVGELRALRWRDVDRPRQVLRVRASYTINHEKTPKSGKVRSVPLVAAAADALAGLRAGRERFVADDDLVFCEPWGDYLAYDRLLRRYRNAQEAAGLRRLRLHDLRHTFGSLAITRADLVEVQEWMGHASVTTTMRYLHYRDRADAARRLASAFS